MVHLCCYLVHTNKEVRKTACICPVNSGERWWQTVGGMGGAWGRKLALVRIQAWKVSKPAIHLPYSRHAPL